MKVKQLLSYSLLAVTMFSCIQDEALNVEAAIDACTGTDVQFTINNNRDFNIYVNKWADLSKQALTFTVPQGATLAITDPTEGDSDFTLNADGTFTAVINFDNANHTRWLTVTSEDKSNSTNYQIHAILMELPTRYRFERLQSSNEPYHILLEWEEGTSSADGLPRALQWCSGNPGFELTKMAGTPQEYPTVQINDGYAGKCVKLQTLNTGSFGAMVNMPIAAGNLFIGSFDLSNALSDALAATRFGMQFYKTPSRLKGYYKFKRGEVYTEDGKTINGKQDSFDIYAFLYEAEDNAFMLDGSNALNPHPSVVLLARLDQADAVETDTWKTFDIPFKKVGNGKSVNAQKLADGKYKLGIVFSSSIDGAKFKGAVGNTLYIDEVELICEEDQ